MATWEDGPEYAPLVRPSEFSSPSAPPLELMPAAPQSAALAPKARPMFDRPQAPVAPLDQLVPVESDRRDPVLPFEVVSSTLTSMDSAWGAAHWSHPATAPAGPPPTVDAWGPPDTGGWPAPTTALPAVSPATAIAPLGGPAQLPSGYPPPGTPQWFGPGPVPQPPPQPPARLDAKSILDAATPGLLICLALGGLIYIFAPIMVGLAFFLSQRVKVAQLQIRNAFMLAMGFLGFFCIAGFLTGRLWFSDWWSFVGAWAVVISWAMLITVLVMVYRGLKNGPPQPPSYTSSWG